MYVVCFVQVLSLPSSQKSELKDDISITLDGPRWTDRPGDLPIIWDNFKHIIGT